MAGHHTQQLLVLVVLVAVCASLPPVAALNFYSPTIRSLQGSDGFLPLDFCPTLSSKPEDCGLPVADAFCKRDGYDRATLFTGPVPVPAGNKTLTTKSPEACVSTPEKPCKTFGMIYCIQEKVFVRPKVDGKLLDWCLDGNQGCGKEAAGAFCVKQGFSHGAWSWGGPYVTDHNTELEGGKDTYQPKTGRVCDGKTEKCQTFSTISCEK